MGEATGNHHSIDVADAAIAVPKQARLSTEIGDRLDHVLLAIRAGKQHHTDAGAHATNASIFTTASSITGFVRKREHISSTSRVADDSSADSMTNRMHLPTRTSLTPSNPRCGRDRSMV